MGTLILLRGTPSSKVVLVACPECGRISKKILRAPYSESGYHALDLAVEYKCPVCTNRYLTVSNTNDSFWITARIEYDRDPNLYNINVKNTYIVEGGQIADVLPSTVSRDAVSDREMTTCSPAIDAEIKSCDNQPIVLLEVTSFTEEKNMADVQRQHHIDNQSEPLTEEPTVAQDYPVIPVIIPPPLLSDDSHKPAIDQSISGWKQKLLDLTKRNKMLQYRETKRTTLRILEPSFDELFHCIAVDEKPLPFQQPIDKDTDFRTWSLLALMEILSHPLAVHIGDIKTEGSPLQSVKKR